MLLMGPPWQVRSQSERVGMRHRKAPFSFLCMEDGSCRPLGVIASRHGRALLHTPLPLPLSNVSIVPSKTRISHAPYEPLLSVCHVLVTPSPLELAPRPSLHVTSGHTQLPSASSPPPHHRL